MSAPFKNLCFLPALMAGISLMLAGQDSAQTFTVLHTFTPTAGSLSTNSDGADPYAGLILSGNFLYGTAEYGGSSGEGTLFKINPDGTGFTNLHTFPAASGFPATNTDGINPVAGLLLSSNTLYGTALFGCKSGVGAIFKVNTDGTGFTNLHSFTTLSSGSFAGTNSDGALPYSGLILSGNTLYGTAYLGGNSGDGAIFKVNTDGTGFAALYSFTGGSDGALPFGGLVLSGDTLFGTAYQNGGSGSGTIFSLNTNGAGFSVIHTFTALSGSPLTNSDGAFPDAALILSANTLYGTTEYGGSSGLGTMFRINTDGTSFTNLHSFTNGTDGENPIAGLVLSGKTLYGTARGDSSGSGTVFQLSTDGTGFTTLYDFTSTSGSPSFPTNSDGASPEAGLILSSNTLYGTAYLGGTSGYGTVFSLALNSIIIPPPQLTITAAGPNVILTWPSNTTTFTLQSTTNLVAPDWTTVSPPPVYVNGQNTVTNPITATQNFYRLSQ